VKTPIAILLIISLGVLSGASAHTTNHVNITTNLLFYLTAGRTARAESTFKSDESLSFMLLGTGTNYIYYRHFPVGNFDFHLFDANGKEIPKTAVGRSLSEAPPKPTKGDLLQSGRYNGYFVDNKGGECRRLFRPDETFNLTNKGVYDLEVRINLCVIMTNGAPDLSAMIDARNVTAHVNDFGVLISPPLRVKVNKE